MVRCKGKGWYGRLGLPVHNTWHSKVLLSGDSFILFQKKMKRMNNDFFKIIFLVTGKPIYHLNL